MVKIKLAGFTGAGFYSSQSIIHVGSDIPQQFLSIKESLFEQDVGSGCGDAAVVVLLAHEHIAVVTPVGRPRILHQPILFAVKFAVTNGQY